MQIQVLVERMNENGYRACSGGPLALTAEGTTQEDAIAKLRAIYEERLKSGTQLIDLDISNGKPYTKENHPWLAGAGMFKDDPMFAEVRQAIAEKRRQIDEDPNIP